MNTTAIELVLALAGELAPALRKGGPTPHRKRGRADPDGLGIGEFAVLPHLKQAAPMTQNDQVSYHLSP